MDRGDIEKGQVGVDRRDRCAQVGNRTGWIVCGAQQDGVGEAVLILDRRRRSRAPRRWFRGGHERLDLGQREESHPHGILVAGIAGLGVLGDADDLPRAFHAVDAKGEGASQRIAFRKKVTGETLADDNNLGSGGRIRRGDGTAREDGNTNGLEIAARDAIEQRRHVFFGGRYVAGNTEGGSPVALLNWPGERESCGANPGKRGEPLDELLVKGGLSGLAGNRQAGR